jgi:hypothetical protein
MVKLRLVMVEEGVDRVKVGEAELKYQLPPEAPSC